MATTARREIRVDRNLCMGSAQCCWYAPNTFDQDDDPAQAIRTAVASCPTGALSIVENAGDSGQD